jgi:hypothetical protein
MLRAKSSSTALPVITLPATGTRAVRPSFLILIIALFEVALRFSSPQYLFLSILSDVLPVLLLERLQLPDR